jgi:hypothetical protein
MTQNTQAPEIPWLDLSAYNTRLAVLDVPRPDGKPGSRYLVLAPTSAEDTADFDGIGASLGFKKIAKDGRELYILQGVTQVDLAPYLKTLRETGFEKTKVVKVNPADVFLSFTPSAPKEAAAPKDETEVEAREPAQDAGDQPQKVEQEPQKKKSPLESPKYLRANSKVIWKPEHGPEVREFTDGEYAGQRFLFEHWRGDRACMLENEMTDKTAVFRVNGGKDVESCAAIIGHEMFGRRKAMRHRDIVEIAEAMFGPEVSQTEIDMLLRGLTNYFSKKMREADGQKFNELYEMAIQIDDHSAYTAELAASEGSIADINLPITVILHRIAAGLAQPDVKVTFTNPGHGSLFSKWKKIGPESDLKIFDSRQEVVDNINALSREFGLRRTERAQLGKPDYTDRNAIVANVETGWLDKPKWIAQTQFRRQEFVEILEALGQRDADGNAIFALPIDQDPAVEEELQQFLEILGRNYAVEGIAEIASAVHAKKPGGRNLMLLSVSARRPEPLEKAPEASLRRRPIFDHATLSTWSAEVIKSRQKIDAYFKGLEEPEAVDDGERKRNRFQVPYISASEVSEAETFAPEHLAGPMRIAMNKLLKSLKDREHEAKAKGELYAENIDDYVAQALGMTHEELASHFSSEQVDAIALDMFAEERGLRGFQIGDQTGIGKGREAAGIALRHINQGRTPIMTTKATGNITDIIRDLGDAGVLPSCNPLILNSGTFEYTDKATGEVRKFEGMTKARFEAEFMVIDPVLDDEGNQKLDAEGEPMVTRRLEIPEDFPYNMIITSYSQVSNDLETQKKKAPNDFRTWKLDFFDQFIDEECVMIMDEAQHATGKGNTGRNLRKAIRNSLRTTFMSATHAKDAATLGLYNILFPEYLDEETIYTLMIKGGETAQEVATAMLAENGVFIRREHDNSRQKFENIFDEENMARNRAVIDSISPILSEVAFLSGDINRRIQTMIDAEEAQLNEEEQQLERVRGEVANRRDPRVRRAAAVVEQRRLAVKSLQSTRLGFGSPLFRIMKNVVSAVKADRIAQEAIKDLQEGRKPIIMADSTIGAVYKNLYEQQEAQGLDAAPPPMLSDFVMREIENMFSAIEKHLLEHPEAADVQALPAPAALPAPDAVQVDAEPVDAAPVAAPAPIEIELDNVGQVVRQADIHDVNEGGVGQIVPRPARGAQAEPAGVGIDPALIQHYQRIKEMVRTLPTLNISLIDEVQRQIREAGFTIDEITGRQYTHDGTRFHRRQKPLSTDIVDDFNNGDTQALIVNRAGLTGLSMQDAPWFRNHGQRVMYEGDAPLDIDAQIQGYGRIGRKGAQTDPLIKIIISGIPAELRAHAARNMKLRRLSANVSSNRDSSALLDDIPDLFNSVGDAICAQYFEARPDLLVMLGFEENHAENIAAQNEEGEVSENKRTANQILARMALLPCALQEEILNDIQAEFEAKIIELDQAGENPLKPAQLQGKVKVYEERIFEGPHEEYVLDAFEAPVKVVRAKLEVDEVGYTGDDLDKLVEESMRNGDGRFADRQGDRIFAERTDRLEQIRRSLGNAYPDIDAAIAAGNNKVAAAADRFEKMEFLCRNLVPGVKVRVTDYFGEPTEAIVVRIEHPWTQSGILSAGNYSVRVLTAGEGRTQHTSIDTMLSDENFIKRDDEGNFEGFNLSPGLNDSDNDAVDEILKEFDAKAHFKVERDIEILRGNTFRAMQIIEEVKNKGERFGLLVAYEDAADGLIKRGVYLKNKNGLNAAHIPVPLRSAEMAYDFLREQDPASEMTIFPDKDHSKRALAIKLTKDGQYEINLPGPTNKDFAKIYEDENLRAMFEEVKGNFKDRQQVKIVTRDGDLLLEWLRGVMANNKIRFWAPSEKRDWANQWSNRKAATEMMKAGEIFVHENADEAPAANMAMAG